MREATRAAGRSLSAGLVACLRLIPAGLVTACSFAYWAEYSLVPVPSPAGIEGVMLTGQLANLPASSTPGQGAQGLCVTVSNARQEPVRILWAGARFIDAEGTALSVLPGDMKNGVTDPTATVPPDSTYEKLVLPTAHRGRSMDAGQPHSHWWQCSTQIRYGAKALLPAFGSSATRGGADRKASRLVGRTFGFTIPVRAGATEVTYRIFFKIDGYRIIHYVDF